MATPSFKDARKQRLEKIKADREKIKKERDQANIKTPKSTTENQSLNPKPSGISSFVPLIQDQGAVLLNTALPFITNFALNKIGINPASPLNDLPCPANLSIFYKNINDNNAVEELNNFIDNINQIGTTLDSFKEVLNTINPIINSVEKGIAISNVALLALQAALKALPPGALALLPAVIISLPDDIDYLKTLILFDNDGTPRIPIIKSGIASISAALTLVQLPLSLIIEYTEKIKSYFKKCLPTNENPFSNLPDFSSIVIGLNQTFQESQQSNSDYYNGFLIEIEEKDFNSNIKQRRAVGKNKSGITLIQTPYSFTTDNQVLFNELKFIIDRDNLKAY